MLHPFISARVVHLAQKDVSGLTLSVLLHASVISLAVAATAPSFTQTQAVRYGGVEHVVFTGIAHVDPARIAHNIVRESRRVRRGLGVARAATRAPHRLPTRDLAELTLSDATLA